MRSLSTFLLACIIAFTLTAGSYAASDMECCQKNGMGMDCNTMEKLCCTDAGCAKYQSSAITPTNAMRIDASPEHDAIVSYPAYAARNVADALERPPKA